MKFKNILIADNDNIAVFINKRLLDTSKVAESITVKRNEKELIDYLGFCRHMNQPMPDLILIDTRLENMGLEKLLSMISLLVTNGKERIKLILLSSLKWKEHEKLMKIHSIDSFIEKPLTLSKLNKVLEELTVPVE